MRRTARMLGLGLLMAAGASVPTIASAQDRPPDGGHHRDGDQGRPHDGGGGWRGGQPQQPRPAPAPPPQGRPGPVQAPQAQGQQAPRFDGRGNGFGRGNDPRFGGGPGRFDGGPGRFDGGDRQQGFRQPPPGFGDRGPQPGYRGPGGVPLAPGSGGYRPQGGPPIAPGSGGYRPQGYHGGGQGWGGYRPAPGYRPGYSGSWNRGWRDDHRYDWSRYRAENRFIYHLRPYYAPPGWGYGYRRFSPGFTLSTVLFEQEFWIGDPGYYRLPPAYWPYQWVRYYNDALLVDTRSGYVVDTVYDIFW